MFPATALFRSRLGISVSLRVRFAHQDRDLAARIADARGPPLATIDDIFVAVTLDAGRDVGRIRGGDVRFGHQEGRTHLAFEQRLQIFALLALIAIALYHFHVAGVGRRAVEHFRRPAHAA